MPSLDLAMPLALFIVVMVALLLNKRVEGKLMATVEKKEFRSRDIILLVGLMSIIISVLAYTALLNPGAIVENILLVYVPDIIQYTIVHVLIRVLKRFPNKSKFTLCGLWNS